MTFQEEVLSRLAAIEQGMKDHPEQHKELRRRIGVLENESIHRSRLSTYISAITAAIVSLLATFFLHWRQS
jgi:hypothetical protein